ncbi:MAG: hypothetical protein Q8T09_13090 [Candidatus Melainabacteria bacterium]|nr:hypothetical protein [Candidatus Melainabacteria bacterium]
MSEEVIKVALPATGPKPIALPLFILFFLGYGFALSFVTMTIIGGFGVFLAVAMAVLFNLLKANNLSSIGWILVLGFAAFWWPLNYFVGRLFIRKFSELGGAKRFLAACLLTLSGLIFPGFAILIQSSNSSIAGLVVPLGTVICLIAQLLESRRIFKERNLPLSSMARPPKSPAKREITEKHLEELQAANSLAQFDELMIKALADFGINKLQLRTTDVAPLEVLTSILLEQKHHAVADRISRNYLEIVERT